MKYAKMNKMQVLVLNIIFVFLPVVFILLTILPLNKIL